MIDLHSHTVHSDGTSSVSELLKEAEQIGLNVLSITDHNTVDAYTELEDSEIRNLFTGKIIPGVEITTTYNGEIVEVLGYGFDIAKMRTLLDKNVLSFKDKQLKEFELIKARYRQKGVIFDENNIKFDPNKGSCRAAFVNEIKKYPENNKFFLYPESVTTLAGFARNEVFNPKSPLYVDQTTLFPSFEKAIAMIRESGGLAFFAHTYAYSPNIEQELLTILNNYQLDGLECFYTTFIKEQSDYLVNLCKARGLYMSGGSDFHGTAKTNHNLGTDAGNLNIDESIMANWTWPKKGEGYAKVYHN